jgi:hypothetical protein
MDCDDIELFFFFLLNILSYKIIILVNMTFQIVMFFLIILVNMTFEIVMFFLMIMYTKLQTI